MSARKLKNNVSWEILFEEEKIIEHIERDGFFDISSSKINEQREARLMTKFDHAVQLPKIFRDNGLSIQPVSRGGYIIGAFNSYFQLPKKSSTDITYLELPSHIETLNPSNIYSESSAILCAFLSGMINDVLGEETDFTVFGRMSTGTFNYQIKNTKTNTSQTISVTNSQCEIDGGFEGTSKLAIIEAKCQTVEDFIIRQLYYPYRLWTSKTNKEVIPIFLSVSNDIFSFYRFHFSELNVYNSIELVSEHRYCLSPSDIDISDIRNILESTKIVPEPVKIPFPQADIFPRIIDLLGRLYDADKPISKDEITLIYAFNVRQTDYYVSAATYLGLVSKKRSNNYEIVYFLSTEGHFIMAQHPRNKNLALVKCILSHKIFNLSLRNHLENARMPTLEDIVCIMRQESEKNYSDITLKRRAQTVRGWVEWILTLTMM